MQRKATLCFKEKTKEYPVQRMKRIEKRIHIGGVSDKGTQAPVGTRARRKKGR